MSSGQLQVSWASRRQLAGSDNTNRLPFRRRIRRVSPVPCQLSEPVQPIKPLITGVMMRTISESSPDRDFDTVRISSSNGPSQCQSHERSVGTCSKRRRRKNKTKTRKFLVPRSIALHGQMPLMKVGMYVVIDSRLVPGLKTSLYVSATALYFF